MSAPGGKREGRTSVGQQKMEGGRDERREESHLRELYEGVVKEGEADMATAYTNVYLCRVQSHSVSRDLEHTIKDRYQIQLKKNNYYKDWIKSMPRWPITTTVNRYCTCTYEVSHQMHVTRHELHTMYPTGSTMLSCQRTGPVMHSSIEKLYKYTKLHKRLSLGNTCPGLH